MRNGPISSMTRASTASEARRYSSARLGSKPSLLSSLEEFSAVIQPCAFDRQHAALCRDAALRREASDFAAGSEHAMAWHDNRERIAAERLTNGACGTRCPEPCGDVAIGQSHAWRNGACGLVDPAMESRHLIHVQHDVGEIAAFAAQQSIDSLDRLPHRRRRLSFSGSWKPLKHS